MKNQLLIIFILILSHFNCTAQVKPKVVPKTTPKVTPKTTQKVTPKTQINTYKAPNLNNHVKFPSINSTLLDSILKSNKQIFGTVLKDSSKYRVQIIYTQINRDSKNAPILKHHVWNTDTSLYFYPASMVKVPVALLALEKMNSLKAKGLNKNSKFNTGKEMECQFADTLDKSNSKGYPTIAHYIKKIFLYSDNWGYDRLFEFLGQDAIHDSLAKKGYNNTRITQRLMSYCTIEENRKTNPFYFFNEQDSIIYEEKAKEATNIVNNKGMKGLLIGKSHWNRKGFSYTPMDFTEYSFSALQDLHLYITNIVMNSAIPKKMKFNLKGDDYRLIQKYMSMYPSESKDPLLKGKKEFEYYEDGRMKYFIYGGEGKDTIPGLRIFNKVGMAAGFLTDCAYIVDFNTNTEFMLSASIFVNNDDIMGDDRYEYKDIGFPFLKNLGLKMLEFEKKRKKPKPNLSFYRIDYSK